MICSKEDVSDLAISTFCINAVSIPVIKFSFNFAIMSSGFKSGSLPHLKYYNDRINLPSLHIFGENDNIIPTGMARYVTV